MSEDFTIRSEAQRLMFEKAAADPDYAESRGIDPALAQKFLDAHKAAGSPKLPERAAAGEKPAKPRGKLLGEA